MINRLVQRDTMTPSLDSLVLYAVYSSIIAVATGVLFIALGILPVGYAAVYSVATFGISMAFAAAI